jgi:hypothetical protein
MSAVLFELLNRALTEEMGVVVDTTNAKQLSQNLHAITKGLDRYADLTITVPSTPNTVIIVKKSVELDAPVWEEGDLPDV